MRTFGDPDGYSLGTIIGWLESQIEEEAEKSEGGEHNKARLEAAYDALEILNQVDDWTPRLTRAYRAKQQMDRRVSARAALAKAERGEL